MKLIRAGQAITKGGKKNTQRQEAKQPNTQQVSDSKIKQEAQPGKESVSGQILIWAIHIDHVAVVPTICLQHIQH